MNISKNLKNAVAVMATTLLLAGLTACGGNSSAQPGKQSGTPFSTDYTDSDGYTYAISGVIPDTPFKLDATNAKPGETEVVATQDITVNIKNITSGHNAPRLDITMALVYSPNSAVCTYKKYDRFGPSPNNPTGTYCLIGNYADPSTNDGSTQITYNQSIVIRLTADLNPIDIAENDSNTMLPELNHPSGWVMRLREAYGTIVWASPGLDIQPTK